MTVQKLWDKVAAGIVIASGAGPEQTREMRRAFYSGAFAALSWVNGRSWRNGWAFELKAAIEECQDFFRLVMLDMEPELPAETLDEPLARQSPRTWFGKAPGSAS